MKYNVNILIIIFIIHLIKSIICIEEPGRSNLKYKIKDYFGSRYLSTFLSSTFLNDEPTIVTWSNGFFIHNSSSDKLFLANSNKNTINYIDKDNSHILVGKLYESGFRDGDSENALFNMPRALVLYNESSFPNKFETKYKPVLFSDDSINKESCIYATISNYTECLNKSYTLEKLAEEGDIYDINPYSVKLLKINNDNGNNDVDNDEFIFLFVTDSKNHCIRKIDLVNIEVTTFAGECNEKGFRDGPRGYNRFNEPRGIGIDSYGNIYVYDSGNKYMRLITPEGYAFTLIHGACFDYKFGLNIENIFNYKTEYLLCFKKWIKNSGEPSEHIYHSISEELCYDNIVNCHNYLSNQKRKDED